MIYLMLKHKMRFTIIFSEAETDDLNAAYEEFEGEFSEEELRLMWIKFMSEMAN